MRSGELFAGVGGLGMAVDEVFGSSPAWFAEFDSAPSKVLAYRHPDVPNLGDVTKIDFRNVPRTRVRAGGFPCTDVSLAGRRAGLKDGTRSGLWSEFARSIKEDRPDWVVIENVRGLLSADAAGDLEPCTLCVGDNPGHVLRALGAVLGDLADLGFDAEWTGIRASDIGAPHGRFRVFIVAWPRERTVTDDNGDGLEGIGRGGRFVERDPDGRAGERQTTGSLKLFSTPDTVPEAPNTGSNSHKAGNIVGLGNQVMSLLPTPIVSDGTGGSKNIAESVFSPQMRDIAKLLPTPEAKLAGSGPDYARMNRDGSGGDDLTTAIWKEGLHHAVSEGRPDQVLQGMRDRVETDPVQERTTGRPECVPAPESLLEAVREHETRGAAGLAPLEGESRSAEDSLRTLLGDVGSARASSRSGRDEQRAEEPAGALQVLPPEAPLAGRPDVPSRAGSGVAWGPYRAAIERWERVLGRPAPTPVLHDGKNGKPRLNPALCEWMMGWPAGHVTDPAIGLSRAEQLKACGNGVVPQQASAALRELLARPGVPRIEAA